MASIIRMPRQGISVESCVVTSWCKAQGDLVQAGETLFTYETDKAAFEEKATAEGVLLHIFHGEGEDVPCLESMCIIGKPSDDISGLINPQATADDASQTQAAAPAFEPQPQEALPSAETQPPPMPLAELPDTVDEGQPFAASPRARALAKAMGVTIAKVQGTGPDKRVLAQDVERAALPGRIQPLPLDNTKVWEEKPEAAAQTAPVQEPLAQDIPAPAPQPPAAPTETAAKPTSEAVAQATTEETPLYPYTETKLSNIRKVTARAMHASLSEMAQLTHHMSFDATSLLEYRRLQKAHAQALGLPGDITLGDMVLYAVARVLPRYPSLNAHFLGSSMRVFDGVHLGVAVDTDRGLLVPTVFNAQDMSLPELSKNIKALAAACREGSVRSEDMRGGTFTVSNLGNLGVEMFTPVINPPQTGILGVCAVTYRPRPNAAGGFDAYPAMGLSLTYDHQALDGAPASRFLQELCKALENFPLLLAGLPVGAGNPTAK